MAPPPNFNSVTRIPGDVNVGLAQFPNGRLIEPVILPPGNFSAPAAATAPGRLHICFVDDAGKIRHTMKDLSSGAWQPFLGDVNAAVNAADLEFADVAAACAGSRLHVVAVAKDGRLLHTIRENDQSWQGYFGDVGAASNAPAARFVAVAAAAIGAKLHVCAITEEGGLLHTIRENDADWQNHMGDIAGAVGLPSPLRAPAYSIAAASSSNDDLHVAWLEGRSVSEAVRLDDRWERGGGALLPPAPRGPLTNPERIALAIGRGDNAVRLFAGGVQREVWTASGPIARWVGIDSSWQALGEPERIAVPPPDGGALVRTLPAAAVSEDGTIHCLLIRHQGFA